MQDTFWNGNMLLTFDIGNTNIVVGGFEKDRLQFEFRLQSDTGRTVDEYAALLYSLFDRALGKKASFTGALVSSVVPPLTTDIVQVIRESFNIEPLIVGPGIKTGIAIKLSDPASVGSDRVVNGVAAREIYGAGSLVVDFGTATTFDYVNKNGDYEGGIIAPGLQISLESLVQRTAKLPRFELTWPKNIIGKSTVAAMQSGTLVGYVCMVDGLIGKVAEEVGPLTAVIATGGLGEIITAHSSQITTYDSTLTLKGMKLIADLNGIGT